MISEEVYKKLRRKYGMSASWAIWTMPGPDGRPKDNIGDVSFFKKPDILKELHNGCVFYGLNPSKHDERRSPDKIWANFHSDDGCRGQDFKLRYALYGTKYWGAYITDVMKNIVNVSSVAAVREMSRRPGGLENLKTPLEHELNILGGNPVLIAMGGKCYEILKFIYGDTRPIVQIMHYANYISKEEYRKSVLDALKPIRRLVNKN